MVGDSGAGGTKGLVPAPAAGDAAAAKYLKADGTWATVSASGAVATDTIWDAKGDLAGGTGANTASRLAVGTNGYVLTADSAEATGMKWAAAAGGSILTDTGWAAKGDIVAATANDTASILTVGSDGKILTADSTASTGLKWGTAGAQVQKTMPVYFDDFLQQSGTAGTLGWGTQSNSGTISLGTSAANTNHPGYITLSTGSSASSQPLLLLGSGIDCFVMKANLVAEWSFQAGRVYSAKFRIDADAAQALALAQAEERDNSPMMIAPNIAMYTA